MPRPSAAWWRASFPLHGRAAVRGAGELVWRNALALTNRLEQVAGQLSALAVTPLPANDLATEQIHEQVKVKVDAACLGG